MEPIRYNLDELIATIPDEMFYIFTNRLLCKEGTEIIGRDDERFETCQEVAKSYVDSTHIPTFIGKIAYFWYMKNPSQQQYIIIEGMHSLLGINTYEAKAQLAQYGLLDSLDELNNLKERIYLVPVKGNTVEEITESFKSFTEDYLPKGAKNISLVLTEEYNFLQLNQFTELLRGCKPRLDKYPILNINHELLTRNIIVEKVDKIKDTYKSYGITQFVNVEDMLEEVSDKWLLRSSTAIEIFNKTAEQVLKVAEQHGRNRVMIYTYNVTNVYVYFAAYMKYFYGIAAVDMDIKDDYIDILCNLVYSPNQMLAADRLLYIRNFPTYTVKDTDFGANIFYTVNRTCRFYATLVEIDEDLNLIGDVSIRLVDLMNKDNELINVTTLYNFDKSPEETTQADGDLKRLFAKFYKKIKRLEKPSLVYPTPCNTFLIRNKTGTYLARLDSISELDLAGYVVSLSLRTSRVYSIKTDNDFAYWLPLAFFNDAALGKKLVQTVLTNSKVWDKIQNKTEVLPRLTSSRATFYYRFLLKNQLNQFMTYRIPNTFVAANLNANSAKQARETRIWEEAFNNSPVLLDQLTSFYCTDVTNVSEKVIRINESMIAQDYIEEGLYE